MRLGPEGRHADLERVYGADASTGHPYEGRSASRPGRLALSSQELAGPPCPRRSSAIRAAGTRAVSAGLTRSTPGALRLLPWPGAVKLGGPAHCGRLGARRPLRERTRRKRPGARTLSADRSRRTRSRVGIPFSGGAFLGVVRLAVKDPLKLCHRLVPGFERVCLGRHSS
jgi:hypothetical protein